MRIFNWKMMALVAMMVSMLAGCGGGSGTTQTGTQQNLSSGAPAQQTPSLYIDKNEQKATLLKDSDNSIMGLMGNGNLKVFPQNVKKIVASSWRLGGTDTSTVECPLVDGKGMVSYDLKGTLNNEATDGIVHWLVLNDGQSFMVDPATFKGKVTSTIANLQYNTFGNGLTYTASQKADTNSRIEVTKNADGKTVKIAIHEGCNAYLWLEGIGYTFTVSKIVFKTTSGATYEGVITDDGYGDKIITIDQVPNNIDGNLLAQIDDATTAAFDFGKGWWPQYDWQVLMINYDAGGYMKISDSPWATPPSP